MPKLNQESIIKGITLDPKRKLHIECVNMVNKGLKPESYNAQLDKVASSVMRGFPFD